MSSLIMKNKLCIACMVFVVVAICLLIYEPSPLTIIQKAGSSMITTTGIYEKKPEERQGTRRNVYFSKSFEHFEINLDENYLSWCDQRHSGLGNRLGTYWVDRSIAFWLNLTFYIDQSCACKSRAAPNKGRDFCRFSDDGHNLFQWTQFLPNTFSYTISYLLNNNTIYNDISINNDNDRNKYILYSIYVYNYYAFRSNILPKNRNLSNFTEALYQPSYVSFFFLNELFIQILRYETQNAFKSYYAQRYQSKNILNEYNFIQSINPRNSIAIHWRCGDVLASDHGAYGFDPFSYYRNALKIWGIKNKTVANVYILANIDHNNKHRFQDSGYIFGCSELFKQINDSLESVFNNYYTNKYIIISNGSINSDQYLLANSKFSLCGFSTFCFMPQFANKHNPMIPGGQPQNWWPKQLKLIHGAPKIHAAAPRNYMLNLSFLTNVAQSIINQ